MDLVYVYTSSKVIAASKENDEKKWYHENAELEDSKVPILEDLDGEDMGSQEVDGDDYSDNGEDGKPIFDDKDAMNDDMYNFDDEVFESPNQNDGDLEVNGRNEYDLPSDEDNCGYGEGIPSIAKYVNGSGFMSNRNLLANKKDTHV